MQWSRLSSGYARLVRALEAASPAADLLLRVTLLHGPGALSMDALLQRLSRVRRTD